MFVQLKATVVEVTLTTAVPLGDSEWLRVPVSVAGLTTEVSGTGGWTAPGVLEAKLVPMHSPHVLEVTVDVQAGTAALEWQVSPLGNVSLARKAF